MEEKRQRRKRAKATWTATNCMICLGASVSIILVALLITLLVMTSGADTTQPSTQVEKYNSAVYNLENPEYSNVFNYKSKPVKINLDIVEHLGLDPDNVDEDIILPTNHTHEGKPLEVKIRLTSINLGPSENQQNVSSTSGCKPGFTEGVNLTLPAEGYMVDIDSFSSLDETYALTVIENAVAVVDSIFSQPIIGVRSAWHGGEIDTDSPNGYNEIAAGSISPSSVLAVTITWGFFSGAVKDRKIIERDIFIGDASNEMGDASLDPTVHHFPRVAVHELLHCTGLKDVYVSGCYSKTIMYGYSTRGSTSPSGPTSDDHHSMHALYPGLSDGSVALPSSGSKFAPKEIFASILVVLFILFI